MPNDQTQNSADESTKRFRRLVIVLMDVDGARDLAEAAAVRVGQLLRYSTESRGLVVGETTGFVVDDATISGFVALVKGRV